MTVIEKLAALHFKLYGKSPEMSFWTWLDAHGIEPINTELAAFLFEQSKSTKPRGMTTK